jgi:uncharacterized protein (TIGR02118 family)
VRLLDVNTQSALNNDDSHRMVKVVLLLHRRADLSVDKFRQYWHERHRPLVERLPGLRRLVLNDVLPGYDGSEPTCDGIAEDWFDSVESMQAAFASLAAQAVTADVVNFLDLSRFQMLMVAEHEVTLAVEATA